MNPFIFLAQNMLQERKVWLGIVGLVLLVIVAYSSLVYVMDRQSPVSLEPTPEVVVEMPNAVQSGFLYFSALASGPDGDAIETYALDLNSGLVKQLTFTSFAAEFAPVDVSHALFVRLNPNEATIESDIFVPMWLDFSNDVADVLRGIPSGWNESDLAASPDGIHVALAQQPVAVDGEAADDISNWQVVVANPEQNTNVVLEAAAMPVWIDGGENLLYTKRDGIYLYNLETGLTGLMYDGYLNLSTAVELAVSPDNQYVALSLPSLNQISVLRVTNSDTVYLEEVRVIQTADRYYRAPVFDPSSQYLATVVFSEVGEQVPTVDVYNVLTGESIDTFSLEMFPMTFFKLNAWETDFLADTAARIHPHD